ncbi:MAG: glycosyltransferase [Alphaproteobacteria bacterium]
MQNTPENKCVAVVVKGWPRLSETFIAQELRGLEQAGLRLRIISLRHPYDPTTHPIHDEIEADVSYLPEYLYQEPGRVWRAIRIARQMPGYRAAWDAFMADLKRDSTANRIRRFGQACVMAAELPPAYRFIYAHFLHTPASVARYAALILGYPFAFSAHAKDIWTTPDWDLKDKLEQATWGATCTAFAHQHLDALEGGSGKVSLIYHGLDVGRHGRSASDRTARDGSDPDHPVELVSVGRAVAKKGYDTLFRALAMLPDDIYWRFTHIGGGELETKLYQEAEQQGIARKIDFMGKQPQSAVIEALQHADIFTLASRVTGNGDRDGLPNVLMEAAAQDLPAVTTNVSGIPEFVIEGETGLMVDQDDAPALAKALETLIRDPERRRKMGQAAHARLHDGFTFTQSLKPLLDRFGISDPQEPTQ